MRYTHIGLADQAQAVNRLPALPSIETSADKCLHIVCHSSGEAGQTATSRDTSSQKSTRGRKRKNPCLGKDLDVLKQALSIPGSTCQKVEAAGIEPAAYVRRTGGKVQISCLTHSATHAMCVPSSHVLSTIRTPKYTRSEMPCDRRGSYKFEEITRLLYVRLRIISISTAAPSGN